MHKGCRSPLVAVGALIAAAAALRAQTPQQPTFKSITDLVQIDAVVVDKQGRHVRGLKASDFTLLDRGKAQTVATFEEILHERVAPASREGIRGGRPI